ncbi:hypothetical protein E4L95_12375 [Paracoccus liaowanqingii]|uniref:Uncharacterized protein n=1 Tax=Paracoccus liaowanqingii TaxID=2560053 RepID=A0A4Z1CGK2_9RHOB|nr:hypothetical protein [Paracoccus liaowanqingii]TGN58599.1 hypothetical protein E4L95_12375 [Paracoccus liaowanqingii]
MDFPKFPRHLTQDERNAVRNEAARAFADDCLAKSEAATGAIANAVKRAECRSEAVSQGITLVTLRWHEERLAEIEAILLADKTKPKKGGR